MINIAVLLTCHNRKEKTLICLQALYSCILPANHFLSVFLVDDGSTDGTTKAVEGKFPEVNVYLGNGKLFWNKGMSLAWDKASNSLDFDFYLWLNDDTILKESSISEMIESYHEVLNDQQKHTIICGACENRTDSGIFSYGGKNESGPIIPNGQLQSCTYINGNAVLVSKMIFRAIGNLCPDYTHIMGDFDYGLRAIKMGFKCYTTKSFVAVCPPNEGLPAWCNPNTPLKNRWQLLHSPKGLNISEYIIFRKKHYGWKWIVFALKAYARAIFPSFYSKLSNK